MFHFLRFPSLNRMFPVAKTYVSRQETYVSRQGNIENLFTSYTIHKDVL